MSEINYNLDERYEFSSATKRNLLVTLAVGVVVAIIGIVMVMNGGHDEAAEGGHAMNMASNNLVASANIEAIASDEGAAGGEEHATAPWLKRLYVTLWQNNVFFAGLGLIGIVFLTIQYASQAGWSAGFKRVPEAMGYWLPFAGIIMVVLYFLAGHDIFHWTHIDLYNEESPHFDAIINGKKAFFFWPAAENPGFPIFWFARLVIFFSLWYLLFLRFRKLSLQEDEIGGSVNFFKMRSLSAIFLVIFAVTSSIAAWDWVMSIDTHWFSTMFGWYVFASWWVAGLAMITFLVVWLKGKGLLAVVDHNHLHDLGKFVFAFSIFWTYIWFSQFLLIFYANIPEESIYFVERINTQYKGFFYVNLFLNFVFPFLFLMTRDSKRHMIFLKIACVVVIFGHWIDFFLMVTPGTMHYDGGLGFMEIGVTMVFLSLFLYVVLNSLSKAPLIAKNHPLLEESLHHHI